MKYEGNICNVCGRPIDEPWNEVPEKLKAYPKFGEEPRGYVNVYLKLQKVEYGVLNSEVNNDGHICKFCLSHALLGGGALPDDIPPDDLPF